MHVLGVLLQDVICWHVEACHMTKRLKLVDEFLGGSPLILLFFVEAWLTMGQSSSVITG